MDSDSLIVICPKPTPTPELSRQLAKATSLKIICYFDNSIADLIRYVASSISDEIILKEVGDIRFEKDGVTINDVVQRPTTIQLPIRDIENYLFSPVSAVGQEMGITRRKLAIDPCLEGANVANHQELFDSIVQRFARATDRHYFYFSWRSQSEITGGPIRHVVNPITNQRMDIVQDFENNTFICNV
ncbi:hypothetical protein DdX_19939 [Ditylenchus destructor]|uniref:Uncharacterized protein n=1 Tax=Ditylenchus destructor TaxID=166010 RepID=A0AAD4QX00_9BILA|nr:hypothetical protein DdX_19939 [Ditylenchus destructor]